MVEPHPGLLKLDFIQYLIRNPQLTASNRIFRNFQNSRRQHLFKDWPKSEPLGSLLHCLNCGAPHSHDNPITADHMIPQVLTKYSDPLRVKLQDEVISDQKNLFSVCQRCHSEIDQYKIKTLGVALPQDPASLFEFLKHQYPITRGSYRYNMLLAVQIVVDKYINVIERYLAKTDQESQVPDFLQPFIESIPRAYEFSSLLYRQRMMLQSELDAECADLVQSHSEHI